MTNREFLNLVISTSENSDIVTFAKDELAKLDARNAKRASTPSKTAVANAPIKEAILGLLSKNPEQWFTSPEVGTALELSTQKAGSLLRQMVADGQVEVTDTKVPRKGMMKVYHIVK